MPPMLEKSSSAYKIWIGVLIAIILVGLYALILQAKKGHTITGMRDNVVWGVYIINFIFFVGLLSTQSCRASEGCGDHKVTEYSPVYLKNHLLKMG